VKTTDNKLLMRPLIFGEVLFDHFPDGSAVLGGAPFNVAWHLQAFGLNPMMISRIGNDTTGEKIVQAMSEWGMDCSGLQRDDVRPTGSVEVSFNEGEPDYDIVDHAAYDYIESALLPELKGAWLLYHGSLALRHACSADTLQQIKENHALKTFVDINLRTPWWQQNFMLELITGADWLKLNEQELSDIYPTEKEDSLAKVLNLISEQLILTGGESGATAIPVNNEKKCSVTPQSISTVVDTVGAGDAFCSVFLAGCLLNWPLEMRMRRAQEFASAIVGIKGATPQSKDFYQPFIENWNLEGQPHV